MVVRCVVCLLPPRARAHTLPVQLVACIGLLNSPASKIVLSFQSTRRRYDALRSTSLPYNFQFPRGLPRAKGSVGIDGMRWLSVSTYWRDLPMCPHTEHTFASSLSLSLSYLLASSFLPSLRFELEYGWLMVFRGPEKSRDIARGIRTRLRSRGLSFVDKRRGVNFVYNLVGEHTRENIAPMLRGTGDNAREARRSSPPIWHFDVRVVLRIFRGTGGIFSPLLQTSNVYIHIYIIHWNCRESLSLSLAQSN